MQPGLFMNLTFHQSLNLLCSQSPRLNPSKLTMTTISLGEETKDKSAALGTVGRLLEVEDVKSMSRLGLVFVVVGDVTRGLNFVMATSMRGKLAVC